MNPTQLHNVSEVLRNFYNIDGEGAAQTILKVAGGEQTVDRAIMVLTDWLQMVFGDDEHHAHYAACTILERLHS